MYLASKRSFAGSNDNLKYPVDQELDEEDQSNEIKKLFLKFTFKLQRKMLMTALKCN